jgi:hypothetical protein
MARRIMNLRMISILALSAGCGGSDYPTTVPISGRVTLDGGGWPTEGEIYFLPLQPAAGLPRRAATAKFSADGQFDAPTSWEPGDGIVPGEYKVYVMCWKVPPTSTGPPPVSYVAEKYQSAATSDRVVQIGAESASEEHEWDFPSNPQSK